VSGVQEKVLDSMRVWNHGRWAPWENWNGLPGRGMRVERSFGWVILPFCSVNDSLITSLPIVPVADLCALLLLSRVKRVRFCAAAKRRLRPSSDEWWEIQANRFMVSLLLPKHLAARNLLLR